MKNLLEQTVPLIDEIEKLFPAPQAQTTLVQQEVAEISDKQSLRLIEDAATGVDSLFQTTIRK